MKPETSRQIFLCGMMGSGKTTVGRKLASELNLPFTDLDQHIEDEQNLTIPEIFNKMGEPAFREIEHQTLKRVVMSPNEIGVFSLGGGSLQNQHLVDLLKENGILVYLECHIDTLFARLKNKTGRPMLTGQQDHELRNRLAKLLAQRQPLYRQAHITINNNSLTPTEAVNKIINYFRSNEEVYRD
jgi:shikimate kinase